MDGVVPIIYIILYAMVGASVILLITSLVMILKKNASKAKSIAKSNIFISVFLFLGYLFSKDTIIGYGYLLPISVSILALAVVLYLFVHRIKEKT